MYTRKQCTHTQKYKQNTTRHVTIDRFFCWVEDFTSLSVITRPGSRRYPISEIEEARPGFEPRMLAPQAKSIAIVKIHL